MTPFLRQNSQGNATCGRSWPHGSRRKPCASQRRRSTRPRVRRMLVVLSKAFGPAGFHMIDHDRSNCSKTLFFKMLDSFCTGSNIATLFERVRILKSAWWHMVCRMCMRCLSHVVAPQSHWCKSYLLWVTQIWTDFVNMVGCFQMDGFRYSAGNCTMTPVEQL